MDVLSQWLSLVVAVAVGWALGRFGLRQRQNDAANDKASDLKDRLQFLFTNYSDEAIEAFVRSLPVNPDTVSLHLSIGTHFRERGEVSRAILVHQNLLARPELPVAVSPKVGLELGQDYLAAGLLDRAEALLQQLMGTPECAGQAAAQLIDIYQQECEWHKARCVAEALVALEDIPELRKQLAYLLCEEAAESIQSEDYYPAKLLLKQALVSDAHCIRAHLLVADLEWRQSNWREARNALFQIFEQNPAFGLVAVERLVHLAEQTGDEKLLPKRLEKLYALHPGTSLLLAWVRSAERQAGVVAAAEILRRELEVRPSLRGLLRLMALSAESDISAQDNVRLVSRVGELLLKNQPVYRCVKCGFAGQKLHWLCPRCKTWESVQPVQGVEGE